MSAPELHRWASVAALALVTCCTSRDERGSESAAADPSAEGVPAVQDAQELEVRDDGSILAGGVVLYDPREGDFSQLEAWLADLAAGMEQTPNSASDAEGRRPVDGFLSLNGASTAPWTSFLSAMELCGEHFIWRVRLTGDGPGGGFEIDAPLACDLTELAPAVLWGELEPNGPERLHITMRVLDPGERLEPRSGAPWGGSGAFEFSASRRIGYEIAPLELDELERVRTLLARLHGEWPEARVLIDARHGTVYSEVIQVVEAIRGIGFEGFAFVRPRG